MTNYEAHAILNAIKMGMGQYFTTYDINLALVITGDLDVLKLTPTIDKPLCQYGPESRYLRTGEASCFSTGEVRFGTMGGNSKANQGEN
jgi:hypothetical protein